MILIGELSLWVALLMATWGTTVSFAGGAQRRPDLIASGERAMNATLAMLILASAGLWAALLTHDFSFEHVASFTSANLPLVYTLSAFWGGPAGALLLWILLLSACSVTLVHANRDRHRELMPYVSGTLAAILAFSLAALCLGVNPYERIEWLPLDGRGMNPQLQNPAIAIHPPSLFLGFAATAIPFALCVGALLTRRLEGAWLAAARRWTLGSWLFLTIGIVTGMWWSYAEPAANGQWTRDAIGSWSLFPWLANTALLHPAMWTGQAASRKWSTTLVPSAFLLSIFAAFIAHGGMISLVHSFALSQVGRSFSVFLVLATGALGYLIGTRLRDPAGREPLSSDSTPDTRFRIGAPVVYAGMVVMVAALVGPAFARSHDVTLSAGESIEIRDPFGQAWTFTSQGVSQYNELNRRVIAAAVEATRAGRGADIITSERRQYVNSRGNPTFDAWTGAGITRSLRQDVYMVLVRVAGDERARMRISFNPLVVWAWIGGAIMAIGGLVALAETARRDP